MNNFAASSAVVVLLQGMRRMALVSFSVTVKIASLPSDLGKSVMKSIAIVWKRSTDGTGYKSP